MCGLPLQKIMNRLTKFKWGAVISAKIYIYFSCFFPILDIPQSAVSCLHLVFFSVHHNQATLKKNFNM